MQDLDLIEQQLRLLETYRSTLSIFVHQRAMFGLAHTPPVVINSIVENRDQIRRIKVYLRSRDVHVDDWPDNEEHSAEHPRHEAYANLPHSGYFVGRDAELAWLKERLSANNRNWQFMIVGIGGVGKSALALATAAYYRDNYATLGASERFDAIIWVSAKETMLTTKGVQPAAVPGVTARTLEDIYTAIAQTLDREDILRALAEKRPALIQQALRSQRTLLVVDNLETIKDPTVTAFLQSVPEPTKVIITMRESRDATNSLRLRGLKDEHAEQLIMEEATQRGVQLNPHDRRLLVLRTWGMPLPIKLSVARLGSGQSFMQVIHWLGNGKSELPKYCVQGQIELARKQNYDTWRILTTCSLFDRETGVSSESLCEINDLSIADYDDAIEILFQHSLVETGNNDRITILPITQAYVGALLMEASDYQQIINAWINRLIHIARTKGVQLNLCMDLFDDVRLEYPTLLAGLRWCYANGRWRELLDIAEGAWFYAHVTSLYNEFRDILEYAINAARQINDLRREGFFCYWLGWLAPLQSNPREAEESLRRAEGIAIQEQDDELLANVYYARANMLLRGRTTYSEDNIESIGLLEQCFAICSEYSFLQVKSLSASRLGQILGERGEHERGLQLLDIAEQAARAISWQRGVAWAKYRLGSINASMGRYGEAKLHFQESLRIVEPWNERYLMADNKYMLATVSAAEGDVELARQQAQDAYHIFERLGVSGKKELVKEFITSLQAYCETPDI